MTGQRFTLDGREYEVVGLEQGEDGLWTIRAKRLGVTVCVPTAQLGVKGN